MKAEIYLTGNMCTSVRDVRQTLQYFPNVFITECTNEYGHPSYRVDMVVPNPAEHNTEALKNAEELVKVAVDWCKYSKTYSILVHTVTPGAKGESLVAHYEISDEGKVTKA